MKAKELKKLLAISKEFINFNINFKDLDHDYEDNGTTIWVPCGYCSKSARASTKTEQSKFWNKNVIEIKIKESDNRCISVLDSLTIRTKEDDYERYYDFNVYVSNSTKEQLDAKKKKEKIEHAKRELESISGFQVKIGPKKLKKNRTYSTTRDGNSVLRLNNQGKLGYIKLAK